MSELFLTDSYPFSNTITIPVHHTQDVDIYTHTHTHYYTILQKNPCQYVSP